MRDNNSKHPEITHFSFDVLSGTQSDVQCLSLLSQVMQSFHDLPDTERKAIAQWFYNRYANNK